MKTKIIKILALVPFFLLLLSSCTNYLELEPQDNLIQQEFWKNKAQVASAVAGCYASMNQVAFTDRVLKWGEFRAEMLVSLKAGTNEQNLMKNYVVPTNSIVDWSSFYATINYCNLVLEFSDGAQKNDLSFSEQELKTYKAEVLAIRSLCYFILVKNFKEVPLILTATSNNKIDFYPKKNTETEIIDQIIADLKIAEADLNLGYAKSPAYDKGRMTKGAALALLSDVYLWSEKYDECIDASQRLIDLGKYQLVDGTDWFQKIFFEGNSNEGIFELQFAAINTTFKNFFYIGSPIYAPYTGITDLYSEFRDDVRGDYATFDRSRSGVFKYAGVSDRGVYRGDQEFYNTFIFYRYADVLLMQAEAYILSTQKKDFNKAIALMSQVHQRAVGKALDVVTDKTSLLNALLLERQKEFAFEGKRWYDLLRFARRNNFAEKSRILEMVETKAGADNLEQLLSYYSESESYFLPIYQNEINLNKNLVQNPYYKN